MEPQAEAVQGDDDDNPFMRRLRRQVAELLEFVERLAAALSNLSTASDGEWDSASQRLGELSATYRWVVAGETEEDLRRIDELVVGLSGLSEWGIDYSAEALREAVREGLQSPVSERGRRVGSGVYVGPPTGIAGADYDVVYILGMVERQFPPRPRRNPWLAQNQPELDRVAALERYDFMAAVAAAKEAVLSFPSATAERNAAYPSRWLIEAANRRHEQSGATGRLTYENLVDNADAKPWLTYIRSREASLRGLAGSAGEPADAADYNLMHLVDGARDALRHHPAIASNPRMTAALDARDARNGIALSPWDGRVELDIPVVAAIGTREYPVSPSALETWATCPHKFFLSRVLRLSALPGEEEEDMSALERGVLVHRILERFVKERRQTDADLMELAEEEFVIAEQRGVTGYPLLWDLAKEDIRARLQSFAGREAEWLAGVVSEAGAEAGFGPGTDIGEVSVSVDGLGEVWFRGKIDRIDVVGDEVRVRDFKTGKPEPYFDGARGRRATRTLANGRALQLPVYAAAARRKYPDDAVDITASYCFPLADNNTHGVASYTEADQKNSAPRWSRSWAAPGAAYSRPRRRPLGTATRNGATARTANSIACVPSAAGRSGSARGSATAIPSNHSTPWAATPRSVPMTTKTDDQTTLYSIVNDLGANLMIEAGAGTGKTYALVSRVVALVMAGVRMQHIVAITFTEAAAAELSERIRSRMEQLLDDDHPDNAHDLLAQELTDQARGRIRRAVGELDQAAVQTIHSFAAQLLRDRPLPANLPPGWTPMDAVESAQRFEEQWDQWMDRALGEGADANVELTARSGTWLALMPELRHGTKSPRLLTGITTGWPWQAVSRKSTCPLLQRRPCGNWKRCAHSA